MYNGFLAFYFCAAFTLRQLLDAKMAELAQEPEGWDDVVRTMRISST